MDAHIAELRDVLPGDVCLRERVPLAQYTTLQAGGEARWLTEVRDLDALSEVVSCVQRRGVPHIILGSGSNVLPSDNGFPGLVIVNACTRISLEGAQTAETGCWFQDLFLNAAQRGLAGLEFAVGIPGTLGGAMVSNAGAYRANIADQLAEIEIVENAERKWVKPDYLQFGYRDSILRRSDPPPIALLSVRLRLRQGDPKRIYDLARDYQRQRITKQPPHASAGSFFKNIYSRALADSLPVLPQKLREAGVVPAGFLIDACGLKGARLGRARISDRHANFVCNMGRARAADLRALAERAKTAVLDRFRVSLEEEVLYIGDWGRPE